MAATLLIRNLHVETAEGIPILRGVNLKVNTGEVVALMGPNGSGKSTLAYVLAGHPSYQATQGSVVYLGQDLLKLKPEDRARLGLFLSFQHPPTIAGVTIGNFLRLAYNSTHQTQLNVADFLQRLKNKADLMNVPHDWLSRQVNEGFSGGEKKRVEMLQLSVLEPRLAILDETDSGLDIDALKMVAVGVTQIRLQQTAMSILVITHHRRILDYLPADRVAIMKAGRIVKEGDRQLLHFVETAGYRSF